MSDEEKKIEKPVCKKCFGLNERKVLRFVIPCAASFVGCLLALAVYASLTSKPPIPRHCPPPPPFHQMYDSGHNRPHYAKHHKGEFRPDRPDRPRFTKDYDGEFNSDRPARPHLKKDRQGRDIDKKRGPDPRISEKAKNAPKPKDSDKK